jgi:hypothetical protein
MIFTSLTEFVYKRNLILSKVLLFCYFLSYFEIFQHFLLGCKNDWKDWVHLSFLYGVSFYLKYSLSYFIFIEISASSVINLFLLSIPTYMLIRSNQTHIRKVRTLFLLQMKKLCKSSGDSSKMLTSISSSPKFI